MCFEALLFYFLLDVVVAFFEFLQSKAFSLEVPAI